jgi:hypothetical protein|tara:strand:+ start:1941 stop:2534 length:594 start_codon:yes stop_codon:yes gene_type:complete
MLYFLCFLCVVVIILIYIKFRLKNLNLSTHVPKKKECKNKLIKYISPQKIKDNKYLIRNLDGKSISYDINNLQQEIFYTKRQTSYIIENNNDYCYIYTDTSPRFYLHIDINGIIKFKLEKYTKGNKWIFLKLNTDELLKSLLLEEMKDNQSESEYIYNKYNYIYKNGYIIKSFDYSYYISSDKLCPNLRDILIISIK